MSYGLCAYQMAPYGGECLEIEDDPAVVVNPNVEEFCAIQCSNQGI